MSIDYSEQKCRRVVAEAVGVKNIPDIDELTIRDAFREYEDNSTISRRVKNLSFHMAVNPSPEDGMDIKSVLGYIDDVMTGLGYGEQPYVVYRHNDIDREHFHVVSVRIRKDGSWINNMKDANVLNELQRQLSIKYGFTVGNPEGKMNVVKTKDRVRSFDPQGLKGPQIQNIWKAAMSYNFRTPEELRQVFRSYGVEIHRNKVANFNPDYGGTGYTIAMRGITAGDDQEDRAVSTWFSLEGLLGYQADTELVETIRRNSEADIEEDVNLLEGRERTETILEYCLEKSTHVDDFVTKARDCGLFLSMDTNEDGSKVKDIVAVDQKCGTVFSSDQLQVILRLLNEAAAKWHWRRRDADIVSHLSRGDIGELNERIDDRLYELRVEKRPQALRIS